MMIITMGCDEETTTMAVVAEALAAIRSQERSGANDAISHSYQQKRCSMGGAQNTRTSIKIEFEDPLIFSLGEGNSFASVKHFRRGCKLSNRWPVR
jgi:hypothetical protein